MCIRDRAIILITHNLGIVARMADRPAVMYAGKIIETGGATDVFTNPQHPYTRGLLRCMPGYGMRGAERRLGSIPGLVPSLIGRVDGCSFRNRCDFATSDCASGDLALRAVTAGHSYRCRLEPGEAARNDGEHALS